jgi:hypothetical protein
MKLKSKLIFMLGLVLVIGLSSCSKKDDVKYGSLKGTVIDSQTGEGLANATVSLAASKKSTGLTVSTDANGDFLIEDVPVGSYTCTIQISGYFVREITNVEVIEGIVNQLDQQTIVQSPTGTEYRIILTWGETPYDLDSHLTGPVSDGSANRFHMYFYDKTPDINVNLDVDDTWSYGPETTTIYTFMAGTYRFSVHNYSDQTTEGGAGIASSPARVEIYNSVGLVKSYTAPAFTGNGNVWRVFELNGTTKAITDINTYVMASSDDDLGTFKTTGKK